MKEDTTDKSVLSIFTDEEDDGKEPAHSAVAGEEPARTTGVGQGSASGHSFWEAHVLEQLSHAQERMPEQESHPQERMPEQESHPQAQMPKPEGRPQTVGASSWKESQPQGNPWKERQNQQANGQTGQQASGQAWQQAGPDTSGASGQNPVPCPYYVLATQGKPWRKRHPILFWGAIIGLLCTVAASVYQNVVYHSLTGPRVAIVNIEGMILDSRDLTEFIAAVADEPEVKGVLLRINSPGGAVTPSQEIFMALERLAKIKPVVASMSTVAASGGYYVALPAERIFAAPATLTASIGVKMEIPNIQELLGKIGVRSTTLTSGALKDAGNPVREMTPEEKAYFQAIITDMYTDFIENVAKHRKMKLDDVRAVADGRAMTGRQALEAGLVDDLGDRDKALRHLVSVAGLTPGNYGIVEGPEKRLSFLQRMLETALHSVNTRNAAPEMPIFFY